MKRLFLIPVMIVLVVGLIFGSCAKTAPTPAPSPAPSPTLAPTAVPSPAPTSAPAIEKPLELKFSSPRPGRLLWGIYEVWAKEIEKLTNGRVKVTVYGSGSLGNEQEQYNLALTGAADITTFQTGATPGVFPRAEGVALPLYWKSNEISSMVFWDLMQKYMKDTEFNKVKLLWVNTTGLQQAFTKTKPVHTLEDFKSMKIGAQSPMRSEMVKALGAVPVFIVVPDMYTALERGTIDGWLMDWEGAAVFKAPEVTKYRTGNVNMSTNPLVQVMNFDVWNSLPPDIQKIIDDKGTEWTRWTGASFDEVVPAVLKQIEEYDQQAGNPAIYYLPDSERSRWVQSVQPVIDNWVEEMEAQGMPGKAMLEDLYALTEKYAK